MLCQCHSLCGLPVGHMLDFCNTQPQMCHNEEERSYQNTETEGFLKVILPVKYSLSTSLLEELSLFVFLFCSPARTASGSRSLSCGPARRSPLEEGWTVCLCGRRWSSKKTQRRQPHSTSAPGSSGTWLPCPAARGTPGPPTIAAASKWAHWSSPVEITAFGCSHTLLLRVTIIFGLKTAGLLFKKCIYIQFIDFFLIL